MKVLKAAVVVYSFILATSQSQAQTCDEDGTCSDDRFQCGLSQRFCEWDSTKKRQSSVYRHGGTAQAYVPGAPLSTAVCDAQLQPSSRHRVANWPLSRSSRKSAPRVTLSIRLWSCQASDTNADTTSGKNVDRKCCCDALKAERKAGASSSDPTATIEVWQARPDGSYSSLREPMEGVTQGDCRTRVHLEPGSSSVTVTTLAPGSTGVLGGLGPSRWDFPPFGPPVVHVLVTAPGHAATLFDVPFLFNGKSLNAKKSMLGGDWRGSAWMRESCDHNPYDVRKWDGMPKENRIEVELDVYLRRTPSEGAVDGSSSSHWCPSRMYGLPSSFFLEPIAVCARPLLDFFAL